MQVTAQMVQKNDGENYGTNADIGHEKDWKKSTAVTTERWVVIVGSNSGNSDKNLSQIMHHQYSLV